MIKKRKSIAFLFLLLAATLSVTACGKKNEGAFVASEGSESKQAVTEEEVTSNWSYEKEINR